MFVPNSLERTLDLFPVQIQLNTDRHIELDESLSKALNSSVENALGRFGERLTRVEVHLQDLNAEKGGSDDIRCVMEGRVAGLDPVAVDDHGPTPEVAAQGAARKLERALETRLGKLGRR